MSRSSAIPTHSVTSVLNFSRYLFKQLTITLVIIHKTRCCVCCRRMRTWPSLSDNHRCILTVMSCSFLVMLLDNQGFYFCAYFLPNHFSRSCSFLFITLISRLLLIFNLMANDIEQYPPMTPRTSTNPRTLFKLQISPLFRSTNWVYKDMCVCTWCLLRCARVFIHSDCLPHLDIKTIERETSANK